MQTPHLDRFNHRRHWFRTILLGILLVRGTAQFSVPGDTNSPILLSTGSGEPLLSLEYHLNLPDVALSPRLTFEFGLATDEWIEPGQFLDSFSITLEGNGNSKTALLLTADAYGVQWAPANPGGIAVDSGAITRQPTAFPDLAPALAYRYAFSVLWLIPQVLAGQLATLYFDLFDNQNDRASLAFARAIRVVTSAPPQLPPWPLLQSAANPAGPYADETGVFVDTNRLKVTVAKSGVDRFYRVRSNTPMTIKQFILRGGDLLFAYEFLEVVVVLQSAAQVEGPYRDETNYTVDPAGRSIRLVRPAENRFYRIRSTMPVIISRKELTGNEWVFFYEYHPTVLGLESSAQAAGPYASESNLILDHERQTLKLTRAQSARFYRVRPDSPYRFIHVQNQGNEVVLSYEKRRP